VVRRSLKDDKRLAAERRGDMDLRFAKWEVSFGCPVYGDGTMAKVQCRMASRARTRTWLPQMKLRLRSRLDSRRSRWIWNSEGKLGARRQEVKEYIELRVESKCCNSTTRHRTIKL